MSEMLEQTGETRVSTNTDLVKIIDAVQFVVR